MASVSVKSNRILALDLLRGYFLAVILIDHLAQFPGFFELFTGKGWLWASAAEGFFIISGVMVGIIRGKELQKQAFVVVAKKLWRRGGQLYLWAVGLTLLYTAIGLYFAGSADLKPDLATDASVLTIVWNTITLQYIYGWADFLPHYAICMLIAPAGLYLLRKRLWWAVLLLSLAAWFMRGTSFVIAWQLLFFGGMVAGYHLQDIQAWISTWPSLRRKLVQRGIYSLTFVTLAASVTVVHVRPFLEGYQETGPMVVSNMSQYSQVLADRTGWLFDKITLAPGRIVVAALWFLTLYLLFRRFEAPIVRRLGWLLLPLGRNSLFVYIAQSAWVFALPLLLPSTTNLWLNIALNVASLLLIWRVTLIYAQVQQHRKKHHAIVENNEAAPSNTKNIHTDHQPSHS